VSLKEVSVVLETNSYSSSGKNRFRRRHKRDALVGEVFLRVSIIGSAQDNTDPFR